MLDTLQGNAAPLLMSLTGDATMGRGKKINWKKVKKGLKKVGKVAAWVAAPQVMATVVAAKAAKGALMRKREKNIGKLQIERAERDRKISEARKAQAIAKQQEAAEAAKARAAEQAERAAEQAEQARQEAEQAAAEQAEQAEEPAADETATEETSQEEIVDTSEEGAEQAAEMLGYSRTNDDYFVGAAALKKPLKKKVSAVKTKSSQLKTIVPVKKKSNTLLYVAGGLGLAALLFNKQLKKALR